MALRRKTIYVLATQQTYCASKISRGQIQVTESPMVAI